MALEGYNRFTIRAFEWGIWGSVIVASAMWLASLADHFLRLGWGWDVQIIWLAPLVVAVAFIVRTLGRMIFRWLGALN